MDQQHFPSLFFSLIFSDYRARARPRTIHKEPPLKYARARARAREHTPEMGALAVALS